MVEIKTKIQDAIKNFNTSNLTEASLNLFKTLGYQTNRQNPFHQKTYQFFRDSFLEGDTRFNEEKAFAKTDWKYIDLLFQISEEEVKGIKAGRFDDQEIYSFLFFSIELTKSDYSRTALSQITREVNKVFPMPVMILFKHGEYVTLSVINRRQNKKDEQKDVLEKVTLIKDISIENPHRAHIEILFDLSFDELLRKYKVTSFVELHNAWQKTLDTKELNKRFYRDLSNWYFWALQEVHFPTTNWAADKNKLCQEEQKVKEHNAKNLIRLLTRLLFVWFIKEKNLIPHELFDESYIRDNLLKEFEPKKRKDFEYDKHGSTYYRAILQNLFFATLNQSVGKREFRKESQHMNVTNLMRYERYFKNPKTFLKLMEDVVPFMNGGLFECLDSPDPILKGKKGGDIILYEDGFSDKPDNTLCVPDYIFFGLTEHADLREVLGDKKSKDVAVRGLINILKSYKFTVTENTPIEEDIALDPELLGRVFENLLASYNPETKTTARKQTGSFYTPREIVNYMVDESLKAYLTQKLETEAGMKAADAETGLELLIGYNEKEHLFDERETAVLIKAIDTCKILDPACGSGAFPMGILHKMVHILDKLDPKNKLWKERQIEKARAIDDTDIRDNLIADIETAFNNNELDYGRKLYLIENCIYGVDIQPIAIQISKLRFFISLIVDQKADKIKDNFGIRPLPNLETKFVAANTLIGIDKPKNGDFFGTLFDDQEVNALEKKLKDIRHRLFSAKSPATKRKLRDEDKTLREKMGNLLITNGWGNDTARLLAGWDPYDQNASSPFFDAEWMFGIKPSISGEGRGEGGFDVVIGNPPYMRVQSLQLTQPEFMDYYRTKFESAKGSFDLYALFVEHGFKLTNSKGQLSYILPHKFFQASFGVGLRKILTTQKALRQIVRFGAEQVFDEATTYTCLLFLSRIPQNKFELFEVKTLVETEVLIAAQTRTEHPNYERDMVIAPTDDNWDFTLGGNNQVMDKILKNQFTLGDITRKIFVGLQTSADKIYVLKILQDFGDILRCYSKQIEEEIEIERGFVRPFLMGKDVHRYENVVAGNVVIFPYWLLHGKAILMSQGEIKKKFPLAWKYLIRNKQELGDRERGKMHGEQFYAYIYPKNLVEFDAVKIMTPDICAKPEMVLDMTGLLYHTTTIYSLVFNSKANGSVKYFLGLLNSKLMWYFQTITGNLLRGGFLRFKTDYLKPFPIPQSKPEERRVVETVADLVLLLKKCANVHSTFFESLIDAMVYELYFPEEIKTANCEVLKHLSNLPELKEEWDDAKKLQTIEKIYKELSDPAHPVTIAMAKMQEVPEVRIIEGKN